MTETSRGFPVEFDQRFLRHAAEADTVFFGLDVLRGLVDGISEHRREHDADKPFRTLMALIDGPQRR